MSADITIAEKDAVARLAQRLGDDDPGASSHWRHYHRGFAFHDGKLEGLFGFGNLTPPQHGLRRLAHAALQSYYRRMGGGLPAFVRLDAASKDLARRQNRFRDLDMLRQVLTLAFVHAHLPEAVEREGAVFTVIGDGFGALGSLILAGFPAARVVLVNLTKTLLVDLIYCRSAVPAQSARLVENAVELDDALARPECRLVAVEARNHALLRRVPINLAFNVVSMQEMDPPVIAGYFADLRAQARDRPVYFYCCNRAEKTLPDGTVTRFHDYPWRADDKILADGPCRWNRSFYTLRPPFFHAYDGPIRHRLARLAT